MDQRLKKIWRNLSQSMMKMMNADQIAAVYFISLELKVFSNFLQR